MFKTEQSKPLLQSDAVSETLRATITQLLEFRFWEGSRAPNAKTPRSLAAAAQILRETTSPR
jgi:hypothetical protein